MRLLISLLFVCSLAPLSFADSADVSVIVTMPSTSVYSELAGTASAQGQFTITNAGPWIAQNVTIDFGPNTTSAGSPDGFHCGVTNGRYVCTILSMVPGSISGPFFMTWPLAPPFGGSMQFTPAPAQYPAYVVPAGTGIVILKSVAALGPSFA